MAWFRHNCSYTEQHNPEHTYTFTGRCVITGELHSVTVKGPDLYRYNHGEKIQDAFPYLSAADREFLISGTSPKGWDEMWGEDEDDDDDDDSPVKHFNNLAKDAKAMEERFSGLNKGSSDIVTPDGV